MPPDLNVSHAERPHLLILLGALGLAGCGALIAGTLVAPFFVPDYDRIADTISDLAAGETQWIMDFALYGFAAGLMSCALAAAHAHLGGAGWSAGVVSLAILTGLVIVIGARDEYGDAGTGGVVIHSYLVYALGLFFLLAALGTAPGAGRDHRWARWTLVVLGLLWAAAAPVYLLLPTGIDGLVERGLGLIACGIVATLSVLFILRGRAVLRGY